MSILSKKLLVKSLSISFTFLRVSRYSCTTLNLSSISAISVLLLSEFAISSVYLAISDTHLSFSFKQNSLASASVSSNHLIAISFETGGVRLHEANAGLLAHAEVMDAFQDCRGIVPVVAVVGSKVGCFGGMGFVAAATDVIVMNEEGRIGLTGPEVIEQEMGKDEFDASNKALVYRTTGAKHKYIIQDCNYLVEDKIGDFHNVLAEVSGLPMEEIEKMRRIGSLKLVQEQQGLVKLIGDMQPKDSMDLWKYYGNEDPAALPEMTTEEFLKVVKRRERA